MILECITGPMFSGKSEELIRRLKRCMIAEQHVQIFKPSLDTRRGVKFISSHDERKLEAIPVTKSWEIKEKLNPKTEIVGLDEIQFFEEDIMDVVDWLLNERKIKVIAAVLPLDFRGKPFPFRNSDRTVADLILSSDKVEKLSAICTQKFKYNSGDRICGREANFTQRLINEKPASSNSPTILVGADDVYEARCRDHHIVPEK